VRNQPVEFLEFIEDDLRYAYQYYESWQAGGSDIFHERFRDTVSWITWNPEMFPKKHRFFRRAIVRRSYFGVFFVIESAVTTVVAVLDMRRNPREIRRILDVRTSQKG
jgi:hypothetical protein